MTAPGGEFDPVFLDEDPVFLDDSEIVMPGGSTIDGPFGAEPALFTVVPVLMSIIFLIVVGVVVYKLVNAGKTFAENSASPTQTVPAKVVARRTSTSGGHNDTAVTTTHFVTFELPDGQRRELKVTGPQYGQLVEGDQGTLTHQGTWYRGFARQTGLPTVAPAPWEPPAGNTFPTPPGPVTPG